MQRMPKRYYAFFTLPTIIAFTVAFLIPFLLGIYLSFTEFTTVTNSHLGGCQQLCARLHGRQQLPERPGVHRQVRRGLGRADQPARLLPGAAAHAQDQGHEHLPHGVLHAQPDRRHRPGLYLAADHQRHPDQLRGRYHLQRQIWFLGPGGADELADGRVHDGDLHRRHPEHPDRTDRGGQDRRRERLADA